MKELDDISTDPKNQEKAEEIAIDELLWDASTESPEVATRKHR